MTTRSLDSIEERIQKPGYLLFLVVTALLLVVGLVDMIDFIDETRPVILGRYDAPYLALLIPYALFTLAWFSLFRKPNDDHLFRDALEYLQERPKLATGVLAVMGLNMIALLVVAELYEGLLSTLPALQVTVVGITLLLAGGILFYEFGNEDRPQRWRKLVLVALGALLLIELALQALSFFGALPINLSTLQTLEDYSAFSRVYQVDEGFGNALTNNYGRYAPDFRLLPDSHRIAILGDSAVRGIQVDKEQQFAVFIEELLANGGEQERVHEVLALGHPDRGPGLYLSKELMTEMVNVFDPDEIIVFFDIGSDFQTVDRAGTRYPFYVFVAEGEAELDRSMFWLDLHEAEHHVFRGYKGIQPALILKSNYLTFRIIWQALTGYDEIGEEGKPTDYEIELENGFMFSEQTNASAMGIALAQLRVAQEWLNDAGVEVKLVTNPVFTEAFYSQERWNTAFGNSDLLLPESQLREHAARYGMPFLGLGTYMASRGMTPAEVQGLYFNNGLGNLTPAGHEFVAEAIYGCFYARNMPAQDGCDLP